MRHVDDFAANVPPAWIAHGGVMLPMYQSEALWIHLESSIMRDQYRLPTVVTPLENGLAEIFDLPRRAEWARYPFAVKIATGKIDAVAGNAWRDGLDSKTQNYVVAPLQPWLDGYCIEKGVIRQFVAMPLGAGYTVEEQLTGTAQHGGLQIEVCPMRRAAFDRYFPKVELSEDELAERSAFKARISPMYQLGLSPGGRMRQEIYADPYRIDDWATKQTGRCFAHILNSLTWRAVTGANPPAVPLTASEYNRQGLPWFDYYAADAEVLKGAGNLDDLKSLVEMGNEKNDLSVPENETVGPKKIVKLPQARPRVREGTF